MFLFSNYCLCVTFIYLFILCVEKGHRLWQMHRNRRGRKQRTHVHPNCECTKTEWDHFSESDQNAVCTVNARIVYIHTLNEIIYNMGSIRIPADTILTFILTFPHIAALDIIFGVKLHFLLSSFFLALFFLSQSFNLFLPRTHQISQPWIALCCCCCCCYYFWCFF